MPGARKNILAPGSFQAGQLAAVIIAAVASVTAPRACEESFWYPCNSTRRSPFVPVWIASDETDVFAPSEEREKRSPVGLAYVSTWQPHRSEEARVIVVARVNGMRNSPLWRINSVKGTSNRSANRLRFAPRFS